MLYIGDGDFRGDSCPWGGGNVLHSLSAGRYRSVNPPLNCPWTRRPACDGAVNASLASSIARNSRTCPARVTQRTR